MKIADVICIFCLALVGCAGDCLKIGGTYDGIEGSIEYCFSQEKSDDVGVPVLENESGEESYVFRKNDIEKILNLISLSTKDLGVDASGHNARKLVNLIRSK